MPSTPLICSSMGAATVSAIVSGLAPGNCALTTTDGGTTSGYSEMGRLCMAIKPPKKMSVDKTPANTGRSMKNFEIFIVPRKDPTFRDLSTRRHRQLLRGCISIHGDLRRGDHGVRANPLQSVDHDAFILMQAGADHPQPVDHRPQRDCPIDGLVVGIDHDDKFFVLIRAHGAVIDQDGRSSRFTSADLRIEPWGQFAILVIKDGSYADGARSCIEAVIDRPE